VLASGRTCTGRMRKEGDPPGAEPNQTSRAALLVPGPALRHVWRPSVAGRQRLKCVRTDPGFSPGRARPPPGCRGTRPLARRTREAEDPGSTVASDRPSTASTERRLRDPRPPTSAPRTSSTGEPPRLSRCRPALERLRKRPSRTGRGEGYDRRVVLVKDFFLDGRIFLTGRIKLRPRQHPDLGPAGRRIPTAAPAIRPWCP
jgi:hypothetical protein